MASRRSDHEDSSFARKFATWVIVTLIIVWASRNPHQAATVVHYIASAIASLASKHSGH